MRSHLANQDWSGAWCSDWRGWTDSDSLVDVDECDCKACLDAVMAYGARAMQRKFDLVERRIGEMKAKATP